MKPENQASSSAGPAYSDRRTYDDRRCNELSRRQNDATREIVDRAAEITTRRDFETFLYVIRATNPNGVGSHD